MAANTTTTIFYLQLSRLLKCWFKHLSFVSHPSFIQVVLGTCPYIDVLNLLSPTSMESTATSGMSNVTPSLKPPWFSQPALLSHLVCASPDYLILSPM